MSEGQSPLGEAANLATTMGTSLANLTSEECFGSSELGVNVGGLIAIIVFYVAVLLVSVTFLPILCINTIWGAVSCI